jgi:excisionase family DNA binding protein
VENRGFRVFWGLTRSGKKEPLEAFLEGSGVGKGGIMEAVRPVFDEGSLAKYLGLSPVSVYRLLKKGDLPGKKIGRVWRLACTGILITGRTN